jgi:hypothetical protein
LRELIAAAAFDDFLADEVAEDIVLDLDEDGHQLLDHSPDKRLILGLIYHSLDHAAAALVVAEVFKILHDFGLCVYKVRANGWEQVGWLE